MKGCVYADATIDICVTKGTNIAAATDCSDTTKVPAF